MRARSFWSPIPPHDRVFEKTVSNMLTVQPPIGAHGAEIRLRLQEIVDCPHETGETGIVRPRLAAYAAQASLYTEAIKNAMGGDCTNIAVLLQKHLNS